MVNDRRIGFVGLGRQGAPMALRLIEAGHEVTLWARRPETLTPFAGTGARVADDLPSLGGACDLVGICVRDDGDCRDVLLGDRGLLNGMAPGGIVAIHSTISPDTCHALALAARERGVHLIDAPVSGGAKGALAGRLAVMVGGPADLFDICAPIFAAFGDPVLHMGALGAGLLTKVVNNALYMAQASLVDHAATIGDAIGLDRAALLKVMAHGSGRSFTLERYRENGMTAFAGSHGLLAKDYAIISAIQAANNLPDGPINTAANATFDRIRPLI